MTCHRLGHNVVAPPTMCVADPAQPGCGRLQLPTRGPRVADLQFRNQRLTHSPAWFDVGAATNTLLATFRNTGEGNAAATSLMFALPVGFAFGQVMQSTPSVSCTTQGTPATVQRVTCSGAGLPSGALGALSMRVALDLSAERPGPVSVRACRARRLCRRSFPARLRMARDSGVGEVRDAAGLRHHLLHRLRGNLAGARLSRVLNADRRAGAVSLRAWPRRAWSRRACGRCP